MHGKLMIMILLAVSAVYACSNDKNGAGTDETQNCTTDTDCPLGTCGETGQCVVIGPAEDLSTPEGGSKDAIEEDVTDEPDSGFDTTLLPDETSPDAIDPPNDVEPTKGVPDIVVDPLAHTFTYLPGVDNPQTKTITIYNEGDWSLVIDKIEFDEFSSPEFSFMGFPPLPKKLNQYESTAITVIFKEKAPHGPATVNIYSNDPDESLVSVVFSSQSKTGDEPCIQVVPMALNFGQVVRGNTKTMDFQVINCSSNLPLSVTDIKRSSFFGMPLTDEFQITPTPALPFSLAGNEAKTLTMSYAPGLAGMDNGHFSFLSNDPALPEAKLDVHGVGVPPPLEEIGLHIELEWDTDDSDVDMHLVRPGGSLFDCESDCYYANMSPDWGAQGDTLDDPFLDYDDVDGYGPEKTNLSEPIPGTYKVVMHYYSDSYEGWGGGASKAIVRIYTYGMLVQEFGPTTLQYTDHTWDVCTVDWPGAVVTPLGNLYDAPDQPMCLPW
jgi:hypothetical protein